MVAVPVPRPRHRADGAVLQPDRRQPARLPRSAHARRTMNPVVEVKDVSVRFATDSGEVEAVDGVSFEVREGEILGLVGESGSGKSVTATAILRLIRKPGRLTHGSIVLGGRDLALLGEEDLQKIRGTEIAMISQTPRTALNPRHLLADGDQRVEGGARLFTLHGGLSKAAARRRAIEMLMLVGI